MKLSEVLNRKGSAVVEVAETVTVRDAARTMCKNHVGCVVIVDLDERIVGILTERDILRLYAEGEGPVAERPVSEVMSSQVITVSPATTVDEALAIMTDRRFRRLPIVDDAGDLSGIVTIGDLVRATLAEKAEEADTLRDYIAS
ncbi:MAG: CBS domain-containing protein [Gammaproteobacteria bacterium]|jgi:CBS domain-containing protein